MSTRSSRPPSPLAGREVLLGVTGGIAAYKACHLVRLLTDAGASVQVVMTEAAMRFVGPDTFAALSGQPVRGSLWEEPGSVLHVALAHEADLVIVAPATANSLAKIAFGLADDLLAATVLEATCPIVVAPAMHSGMFESRATQDNLRTLEERGIAVVGPATGRLAHGDEGIGRMVEPDQILAAAEQALGRGTDLSGVSILVTAGPTWEPIDAVRYVGNRSTGRMGIAVAEEASRRGAVVEIILGPGTTEPPANATVTRVTTALQMQQALRDAWDRTDVLVMAAAVADFRPEHAAQGKLKKEQGPPSVQLVPNPDILAELAPDKGDRTIVGFAAETSDFISAATEKLRRKGLDAIVVNEVGREGTGFGATTNNAAVVTADDVPTSLDVRSKAELAREIMDVVVKLRAQA